MIGFGLIHNCLLPAGDLLATCSGDRTVRIWAERAGYIAATATGGQPSKQEAWTCTAVLEEAHSRTIRSVSWSPNGRYLATASFDATTAVWEIHGDTWELVCVHARFSMLACASQACNAVPPANGCRAGFAKRSL